MSAVDWFQAAAAWIAILVLAILNGALREKVLVPRWGVRGAYMASGMLLSACIVLVAYATAPWFGATQVRHWWGLGGAWLLWTLLFEFGFGRLKRKPWRDLVAPYTFRDGNLWPLVLVVTLTAPWVAAKMRGFV